MRDIIVFGAGQFADAAWYYLIHFSEYRIAGYTVEKEYLGEDRFHGRLVVPWDEVEEHFSPLHHGILLPVSFRGVNGVRERLFHEAMDKGYKPVSFVHPDSAVYTDSIGKNCFITEHNTINPYVKIGDNVQVWCNNHIGHHTVIEDHVFVTSECCICGAVHIGERTFVGVNSTIRDNVTIGRECVIGAGAVVTTDLPDYTVIVPARSVIIPKKSYELEGI